MISLVIPSNRANCLKEFLTQWKTKLKNVSQIWENIIVIEDNETKTFDINIKHHYSWKEIHEHLGDYAWIISKRDSAIRSYGFLKAYELGADYTITLDDDCYPENGEDLLVHIDKMENTNNWDGLIPGFRTRGMPYKNLAPIDNVVANVGLWTNVPDFDSIQSLSQSDAYFNPPQYVDRVLPKRQYFSLCGMNIAFKRSVAVLTYFPLMGMNSPYRRFDDIWFGITFKKICDHLNLSITCGHPFVHHSRASDPFANLVKEAPGIAANETFWETIDQINLKGTAPKECMIEVGESLQRNNDEYIAQLGRAILIWTNYFK